MTDFLLTEILTKIVWQKNVFNIIIQVRQKQYGYSCGERFGGFETKTLEKKRACTDYVT